MDRQDVYIFTHFTGIAEVKKLDVRNGQAQIARTILRNLAHKMVRTAQIMRWRIWRISAR